MFNKLFKPRWQHKDPMVRLNAVQAFNPKDPTNISHIEQILLNDDDQRVRDAALGLITETDVLLKLANNCKDQDRKKILARIIEQITHGTIALSAIKRYIQQYPSLPLLNLFAEFCPQPNELLEWLDELPVETTLLIANLSRHETVRTKALNSINDETTLRQLSKQSDKLDKRSNQIVREKLKQLREQEQAQKEQQEKLEKLCLRIESLTRTQHNVIFDSELFQLEKTWQHVLKDIPDTYKELITRGNAALAICQEIKRDADKIIEQARLAALEAEKIAESEAKKKALENAQKENAKAEAEQASSLVDEIRAAQKALETEKQKRTEEKHLQILSQINDSLPILEKAIEEKNLKKAKETANTLQNAIRQLDPKRANTVSGKLQLLQNQLRELQDWQEYAALPKLEELCARMEQLITTALPAAQKAGSIRDLQEQWRTIKIPSSSAAQELWQRFKQASDTAYIPCADHFAKEKELRNYNLAQRIQICESLEQYYQQTWNDSAESTQNINWKALQNILTKAKQEFHDFHPVERGEEKSIKERFDTAVKQLNDQLYAEYQRNEAQRQSLIEEVKQLLTIDDLQKAIDRTRSIQQEWKSIGMGRRTQDQKLWEEFQKSCNAIFEKRQESRQQAQQEQKDKLIQADSICEQINVLAKLPDAELSQSKEQFNNLQEQFNAIDFDEKTRSRVSRSFKEACDNYQKQFSGIGKREKQRQHEIFVRMTKVCEQLEYKPDSAITENLIQEWEAAGLSGHYLALLQSRYQEAVRIAKGETTINFESNEQQRRQILIELEILTDSETPEEDRQRRSDYQMQALQKNFGKASLNSQEQKDKLLTDWHVIGAASPEIQRKLQIRFDLLEKK